MTMVPMWKTCPKCHKRYDFNPDVGNFNCPYCHGLGNPIASAIKSIFGKNDSEDESDDDGIDFKNE